MNIACYFPESKETQKRHMHGQQQGIRSTKKKTLDVFPDTPTSPPHNSKKEKIILVCQLKKTMYSNQRGLFPQVSSIGNKHIMVIHDVDSNSLWAEALKNNTGSKLILGHAQALEHMQKVGIVPKLGWEIRLEFRRIPQLIQFRTFSIPEFSSEFYFSDRKMCSRQF
jgi:hypothetical protein